MRTAKASGLTGNGLRQHHADIGPHAARVAHLAKQKGSACCLCHSVLHTLAAQVTGVAQRVYCPRLQVEGEMESVSVRLTVHAQGRLAAICFSEQRRKVYGPAAVLIKCAKFFSEYQ